MNIVLFIRGRFVMYPSGGNLVGS